MGVEKVKGAGGLEPFGLLTSTLNHAVVGYSSGQRGQTVNLLAYAYEGSNPSPTTIADHASRVISVVGKPGLTQSLLGRFLALPLIDEPGSGSSWRLRALA